MILVINRTHDGEGRDVGKNLQIHREYESE